MATVRIAQQIKEAGMEGIEKRRPAAPRPVLVVVASLWFYRERDILRPGTLWITQGQLHDSVFRSSENGNSYLAHLLGSGEIRRVILNVCVTDERRSELEAYFKSYDIDDVRSVTAAGLRALLDTIPALPEERREGLMNFRFPFHVLRGRQNEMAYLVAGFAETEVPADIRGHPRVRFVPKEEISFLGRIDERVQAAILCSRLGEDDLSFLKSSLRRIELPTRNIAIEESFEAWIDWFRKEFKIAQGPEQSFQKEMKLKLVIGCDPGACAEFRGHPNVIWWDDLSKEDTNRLPLRIDAVLVHESIRFMSRRNIEDEANRRSIPVLEFGSSEEVNDHLLSSVGGGFVPPKVLVLGADHRNVPEIAKDPLFMFVTAVEANRLERLPFRPKLTVLLKARGFKNEAVRRLAKLAEEAGSKWVEIIGDADALRNWLHRTDIGSGLGPRTQKEDRMADETLTTTTEARPSEEAPAEPAAHDAPAQTENESQPEGGNMKKSELAKLTNGELIKMFWPQTAGDAKLLRETFKREAGKDISLGVIYATKSTLLKNWSPPAPGAASDSPEPPKQPKSAGKKRGRPRKQAAAETQVPAPSAPTPVSEAPTGSASERFLAGIARIEEGLALLKQSFRETADKLADAEARYEQVRPLLEILQKIKVPE